MTFAKALTLAGLGVLGALLLGLSLPSRPMPAPDVKAPKDPEPAIMLSETQVSPLKIEPAGEFVFPQEIHSVGTIDFNQELLT